jgi:diguanylate cyclase
MRRTIHRLAGLLFAGLCVFVLLGGTAGAQPAATLEPGTASLDLAPHVRYFRDADGHASADGLFAHEGEFQPLPAGGPIFGFQDAPYWFRAEVVNHSQVDQYWILLQEYALSDFVDLYARYADGRIVHQASGDMRPFRDRAIRYRQPNFRVHLPAGEPVELLLRVRSESSMQVPLSLHTPKAFAELARDAQFGMGIYYGILIALLVYNLVLWLWLRDQSYFWYLFHVGGFGLVLFCLNGFGFEYLWPASPQLQDWSVPVSICIAQLAMQQFARHFLDTAHLWRLGNRIALGFIAFFALLGIAGFVLPYHTITPIASAAVFPSVIFIAVQAVVVLRRGFAPARLFLLAWAMFLLGTAVFAAVAFGLLPKTFYTEYGVQLGSALEMLLLSVALGYRYASLRNENIRIVREANEKLERNVVARTAELRTALAQLGEANVQLREYSRRDPLTGTYNRRHFRDAFEERLREVVERGRPLALLLGDVDNFKQINDTYGHVAGDECLRAIAHAFHQALDGHEALVARFGGEEFVAVLPGMDAQQALQAAEALRMRIQQSPVRTGKHLIRMSISIGVHSVPPNREMTPEEVLRIADEALYRAKNDGRNCVRHSVVVA